MRLTYILPALLLASPAAAQDAASGKKPGETFKDCAECQTMVVVPAGRFKMGSTEEERAREGVPPTFGDHEGPVRDITIAKPFAVATTETTRGHFAVFARETNRPIPTECATYNPANDSWAGVPGNVANWQKPGFAQDDTHPVVCASWTDASEYAAWLSKKTGRKYRLASEAEWEYVARAGTTTARPWGDSWQPTCTKAHIMTTATFTAIKNGQSWMDELLCSGEASWTVPVASFDANPWGVYDMLGNVWEWVADCAAEDHSTLPADGSPQTAGGDCKKRVTKGGAFHSRVWLARPATRGSGQDPVNRPIASGIRVVREL
jgi:formylglycine-generating enzyme required for sulfatase activity